MTMGSLLAGPADKPMDEYRVKAGFVYNFVKFVEWPSEAFRSPAEPYGICVLGEDRFSGSLEGTVAGREVAGRPIVVRHVSAVKQVKGCHVLYISSAGSKRIPPLPADVTAPGVLTIGESDDSAAHGAVINLKLAAGRIRFDINVGAAERSRLRISSQLLKLADNVGGRKL
jgi:hypothetical protein